jgi:hypothetical protein
MESHPSLAEDLPALYRAILDGVAELERLGQRRHAAAARAEATHVYSTSWDETGFRKLDQIRRRIDRLISATSGVRSEGDRAWRPATRRATPQHDPI